MSVLSGRVDTLAPTSVAIKRGPQKLEAWAARDFRAESVIRHHGIALPQQRPGTSRISDKTG
jgi:hypothetical protein